MHNENKVIYPELSYKIIGILFNVWNDVGYGHKENFYQKATALGLKNENIHFNEQVAVRVKYKGKEIGIYFLDFLIENKIVLEIKKREYFSKKDIEQLYAYLKATNLKLGIIAHFTKSGVKFKRVLNIN
ncbi:MAG: GxxExxY protein [Patescibacteria group bacterium]